LCWFAATVAVLLDADSMREIVALLRTGSSSGSRRRSPRLIAPSQSGSSTAASRAGATGCSRSGRGTRGSRVVLSIVRGIEAQASVQPLCARAEILGDAVDELLTLQLHLERLGRVRHDEGIRRGRLSQVPGGDFRPLDVERIGRSASRSLAHCGRAERVRSRMKRWCSPRTSGYLLRYRCRHRAGYATQPLFRFRQTSC